MTANKDLDLSALNIGERPEDKVVHVSSDSFIHEIAAINLEYFYKEEKNGINFGDGVEYLGLGVGSAVAERQFVKQLTRELGIEKKRVVLEDKDTSQIQSVKKDETVVPEEMSIYLRKAIANGEQFNLISAFGMEFVFRTEKAFKALFAATSMLLKKGGVLVISEYDSNFINTASICEQYGFKQLDTGYYVKQ